MILNYIILSYCNNLESFFYLMYLAQPWNLESFHATIMLFWSIKILIFLSFMFFFCFILPKHEISVCYMPKSWNLELFNVPFSRNFDPVYAIIMRLRSVYVLNMNPWSLTCLCSNHKTFNNYMLQSCYFDLFYWTTMKFDIIYTLIMKLGSV